MEFSLFDQLTKKESFTDSEIKQASLYRDYLASSQTNSDLASFLRKAIKNNMADQISNVTNVTNQKNIKNNMADQIKEQKEKELESDYEDRKRSLIYV